MAAEPAAIAGQNRRTAAAMPALPAAPPHSHLPAAKQAVPNSKPCTKPTRLAAVQRTPLEQFQTHKGRKEGGGGERDVGVAVRARLPRLPLLEPPLDSWQAAVLVISVLKDWQSGNQNERGLRGGEQLRLLVEAIV